MNQEAFDLVLEAIELLKKSIRINPTMPDFELVQIYRHGSSLEMMLYADSLSQHDIDVKVETDEGI